MIEHLVNIRIEVKVDFDSSRTRTEGPMGTMLVLWSYESGGQELYALSSGRVPPAEDHSDQELEASGNPR